jgi:APA family basic amino acid/polyamine antiporter
MSFFTRRKALDAHVRVDSEHQLKKSLSWPHLVALGIGGIIGTGIYTLTGIGAERAGPAVILAFAACGVLCMCASLAYAEMATLLPAAGSAYTYTYSVIGEGFAWIVGWSLVLEYALSSAAVSVGWSGYMVGLLHSIGVDLPPIILAGPHAGGIVNLPAVLITLLITALLAQGTKESATVNIVLVAIKMIALAVFIGITALHFAPEHLEPFMPYGFASQSDETGHVHGVMAAAAIVFFAFFGFDAVSTSAEEVKNPGRDLTIGIVGSMVICTIIYMVVAACAVGSWPFQEFAGSGEPLAFILRSLNHPAAAFGIGAAAIVALPSVILVMMYGQTRVFFVMARDGLLPRGLSEVHQVRRVPVRLTVLVGLLVAFVGGFFRLDEIAELSNAGTLTAFIAVSVCVMILRKTKPDMPRLFRCPAVWIVAPIAVLGCLYFMFSLPAATVVRFLIWNAIGLLFYFVYGRVNAVVAKQAS